MRRGLISHSRAELPDAILDARIARVREAMGAAGLDKLLVYTNNTRPAGVSWLTGFVPYWSEALLVVSRDRGPVLVAALSHRVKRWIERTSRVAEVMHSPRIGFAAAGMIAGGQAHGGGGGPSVPGPPPRRGARLRGGGPRALSFVPNAPLS